MREGQQEKVADKWPENVVQLAGAWQDFPEREEIGASQGEDIVREESLCDSRSCHRALNVSGVVIYVPFDLFGFQLADILLRLVVL